MGRLVRTIQGSMIDLVLEIRSGSPTLSKAIALDEWVATPEPASARIWVASGFVHGNMLPKANTIEYFRTGDYSSARETSNSPLASDSDRSLCEVELNPLMLATASRGTMLVMDRQGLTVEHCLEDKRSNQWIFAEGG